MRDAEPYAAPTPKVFTGSVGPKSLAVTGQLADGWIPPGGSDWRSQLYRESRPRVDAAAAAAGRDPAQIVDVYNFGGRITAEPLAAPRGEDGRWRVRPVGGQGSHQLWAAAGANALALVPDGEGVAPGDQVDAMLIKRLGLNRQAITWPIGANVA